MPAVVVCPNCRTKLAAPDELRGKQVACPTCQTAFLVAGEDAPPVAESKPADVRLSGSGSATLKMGAGMPASSPPANVPGAASMPGGTTSFGGARSAAAVAPSPATAPNAPGNANAAGSSRTSKPGVRDTISMKAGVPNVSPSAPTVTSFTPVVSPGAAPANPYLAGAVTSMGGGAAAAAPLGTATVPGTATPNQASSAAASVAARPATPMVAAPRQAKFISADVAQSRIQIGADGQLPQLNLTEGEKRERNREKGEESNPMVIIGVLAFSVAMSVMLLIFDPSGGADRQSQSKADARYELELHYMGGTQPLKPYQELLRAAQQARNRGALDEERQNYRKVLDLLHSEGNSVHQGVTDQRNSDTPPNDRHLEAILSKLLSDP